MGRKRNRAATALMTVAGLALLIAVMGGVALVTKTEPLVSERLGKTVVTDRAWR